MKEIRITQVTGGYIVAVAQDGNQQIQVTPNLGRAVKVARGLFGEDQPEVVETIAVVK